MKKINLLLITVLSSIFFSCGNKEGKNDTNDAVALKELAKACGCNELVLTDKDKDGNVFFLSKNITKKDSKELFTGNCVEIDQNDSIVQKLDVKNGWLTNRVTRQKIRNKYITSEDMKYDQGDSSDGFIRLLDTDENDNYFVSYIVSYKNGELYDRFSIFLSGNKEGKPNNISLLFEYSKGKYGAPKVTPKCMPESEFTGSQFLRNGTTDMTSPSFDVKDISPERYYEILNCLNKEYPQFEYWRTL
jgi:hypothetical protein